FNKLMFRMLKSVKPVFFLVGLVFSFSAIHAQTKHGLEKIIVEKYYVSDAKDAKAIKGGHLPVGSVTYRIFVDMLPAYRFEAAYGLAGHELRIATTTSFFNNEEYGAAVANNVPEIRLKENTVMLDSWLSVGAAAENSYAVLKSEDTAKAIVNKDGLLQNADPSAGIPIKTHVGFYHASPMSIVTTFGIDSTQLSIFGKTNN